MKRLLFILLFVPCLVAAQPYKYYVSPYTGSDVDSGLDTANAWSSWQKAFETADAGDTVFFLDGEWYPTVAESGNNMCIIDPSGHGGAPVYGNDGTYANPIVFMNYPGCTPVLDLKNWDSGGNYNTGIMVYYANYIQFIGLQIRNIYQYRTNVQAFGINCYGTASFRFERMNMNNISGNAIRFLSGFGDPVSSSTEDSTYFINNDIYDCADTLSSIPYNYADGIKADIGAAGYMYFYGNRIYRVCDDGIDVSGAGLKIIDRNWLFDIGNDIGVPDDGNGLKSGGVRDTVTYHTNTITNNLIAYIYRFGIHCLDYNPYYRNYGLVYNNTIYTVSHGIWEFTNTDRYFCNTSYKNNIVYTYTGNQIGVLTASTNPGYDESNNSWRYRNSGTWWEVNPDYTITDDDFVSMDDTQLYGDRDANGDLPVITFLQPKTTSELAIGGVGVGLVYDGNGLVFDDDSISLGAFQAATDAPPDPEEPDPPTVATSSVTGEWVWGANGGGTIVSDGGGTISARGICWSTSENPTISGSKAAGTGTNFTGVITGLASGTTYYVRAYATNETGTSYGSQVSFTTPAFNVFQRGGKFLVNNGKIMIIK